MRLTPLQEVQIRDALQSGWDHGTIAASVRCSVEDVARIAKKMAKKTKR